MIIIKTQKNVLNCKYTRIRIEHNGDSAAGKITRTHSIR